MAGNKRRYISIGDSNEWFWLFGLLAMAPVFVSPSGPLATLAGVISDATPAVAVSSSTAPTSPASIIQAVPVGTVAPVDAFLYWLLALSFCLAGQCRDYVKFAPALTLLTLLAAGTAQFVRGDPVWSYVPPLILGIFAGGQFRNAAPASLDWRHEARAVLATAALWLMFWNALLFLGLFMLALAAFGMGQCRRISGLTVVALVLMCVSATWIESGDSGVAVARAMAFGASVLLVIVQFGRTGRLASPSVAIAACVVILVWLNEGSPAATSAGAVEPSAGSRQASQSHVPVHLVSFGEVNWLELSAVVVSLVLSRWVGLIAWHNRKTIAALRANRSTASLFREAFWASTGVLALAAFCWVLAYLGMTTYNAVVLKATQEQVESPTEPCPTSVTYSWSPQANSLLTLSRVEIERLRLETHRCLDFRIQEAIQANGDSVATVQNAAKNAFSSIWPAEIVRVPSCPSFFWKFPVTCYIERAIKKKINEKYSEAKNRTIQRFNERTDLLARAATEQGHSSGAYLHGLIKQNVDIEAEATDRALVESNRVWALISFFGTCYLLLLALKLYLAVAARFVHQADGPFKTPLSVRAFRKGAVYRRLEVNKEGNYRLRKPNSNDKRDFVGWHLSSKLNISGVTYSTVSWPYRPLFAPFHRLRSWYWTRQVTDTDNPEIQPGEKNWAFIHVMLGRNAGVVFNPRDLVGFKGRVDFRVEWNYRLIALVFLRHRFYTARGPGELLIRLPGAASTDTTMGVVTMVRILNAHECIQVNAPKSAWNVAWTPESVTFPRSSAWLANPTWFNTKVRQVRAFLFPF